MNASADPYTEIEFPFVGRPDQDPFRYVYVLKLANGQYYVGTTSDPERRISQHRAGTGAVCTRMSLPVAVVAMYRFRDCYYAGLPARERVEMHVAVELSERVGAFAIQGARHGSGVRRVPTAQGWSTIRRNEKFIRSDMGRRLMATVETLPPGDYDWLLGGGDFREARAV